VELVSSVNRPHDIVSAQYLDHMMINFATKFDMDQAREIQGAGAKLWFQNIGVNRYTEGALMIKTGAIGRRQFTAHSHLLSRQYYPPMGTVPKIRLKWAEEGVDDQRYYYLLKELIAEAKAAGKAAAEAAAAEKELKEIMDLIPVASGGTGLKLAKEQKVNPDGYVNVKGFADAGVFDQLRLRFVKQILILRQALGK
jgi:hypothetical protein